MTQHRKHLNVGRSNNGKAFKEIIVRLKNGQLLRGFENENDQIEKSILSIWIGKEIIPRFLNKNDILSIEEIEPIQVPQQLYVSRVESTGGLGKHIRWTISIPSVNKLKETQKATLIVGNIKNDQHWCELKMLVSKLHLLINFTNNIVKLYESTDFGKYTSLTLLDHRRGPHVGFLLAEKDYYPVFPNELELREVDLIPERLDRSPHMYLDQHKIDAKNAGPQRDAWRWKLSWLPKNWTTVFTWPGYAKESYNELLRSNIDPVLFLDRIPSPLNYYMWEYHLELQEGILTQKRSDLNMLLNCLKNLKAKKIKLINLQQNVEYMIKKLELEDALVYQHELKTFRKESEQFDKIKKNIFEKENSLIEKIKKLRIEIQNRTKLLDANPKRSNDFFWITPAISKEQNEDLLNAAVLYHYSVQDEETMISLGNRLFRYSQTGFVERCLGTYTRDGNHRGFGQTLRNYSGEEKISPENMEKMLSVHIRNRITVDSNSQKIWGCGGRVYRGRYPTEENKAPLKKIKHFHMDEDIRKQDEVTELL